MSNPGGNSTLETNEKWLDSIRRYVIDVDARILDLHHLDLTVEEIKSILEFLAGSQINELDLSYHNLRNQMDSVCKLLIKTKIKKLNVTSCKLTLKDVVCVMSILKDLQITDLNISGNWIVLSQPECNEFIAFLRESHLTSLNLRYAIKFINSEDVSPLIDTLCKTSITHLNLDCFNKGGGQFLDAMLALIRSLKDSAITHLSLAGNDLHSYVPGECSSYQVKVLFKALVGSQVSYLNLENSGDTYRELSVSPYLKHTQIKRLDLSKNSRLRTELSDTSLVSLRLNDCSLIDCKDKKLMKRLMSSKLEELDVGNNRLTDATLLEFSRCVTETAITSVNFSGHPNSFRVPTFPAVAHLLGALKNSNVSSLKLRYFKLNTEAAEIAFPNLKNTKLTHLDLGSNNLGGGLQSLAAVLEFTALTHLNLKKNYLNDEDAKVLAECVKETCVSFLNLGGNEITDSGAVALAASLKGSNILSLKLKGNQIENPGLEALASNAEGTFITTLKVSGNPGNRRIVDTIIWNNRRSVLEFVRFFKQIISKPGMNSLRFGDIVSTAEVDKVLDECLNFYNTFASNQSTAVVVLSRDEYFTVGRDEITSLLFEAFPREFVQFIITNIEAEISEYLSFLMKVEEMGLTRIVEHLLLNRPIYTIDESQGILHPFAYQLLNKYKLPICNVDVEPRGIERIIEYFTENQGINGAGEVIAMLKHL